MNLGLDRMKMAIEAMGLPCKGTPAIQIAGTNGKGSISSFINSILTTVGIKTGITTSPHLVDWIERICINDKQIPGKFNVPQVIGRFRVYKTEVLKINSNKIDLENIDLFKKNLKKIAISYNALIGMINKIAKESLESTNNLDAVEVK